MKAIRKPQLVIGALFIIVVIYFMASYRFEQKYWVGGWDVSRDYLVANHITRFREFPNTGPWNSVHSSIRNNPLYYYVLAALLLLRNDIIFLGWANLLLQLVSLIMIYALAARLFSSETALIAVILYGFSAMGMRMMSTVWQPYLMQPFLIIGYYFIWSGIQRVRLRQILIGILWYAMASALHFSALAVAPLLFAFILFTASRFPDLRKYRLIVIGWFVACMIAVMLPVWRGWVINSQGDLSLFHVFAVNSSEYLRGAAAGGSLLLTTFFIIDEQISLGFQTQG